MSSPPRPAPPKILPSPSSGLGGTPYDIPLVITVVYIFLYSLLCSIASFSTAVKGVFSSGSFGSFGFSVVLVQWFPLLGLVKILLLNCCSILIQFYLLHLHLLVHGTYDHSFYRLVIKKPVVVYLLQLYELESLLALILLP